MTSPIDPNSGHWKPRQPYEDHNIGDLVAGPGAVSFNGRIVNIYEQQQTSKRPKAAKGLLRLIVRDDTGAFVVSIPQWNSGHAKETDELSSLSCTTLIRHTIPASASCVRSGHRMCP